MIYHRGSYLIGLDAESAARQAFPISRGEVAGYFRHACNLLTYNLLALNVGAGNVVLLVDLPPNLSVLQFVRNVKSWTADWIGGASSHCGGAQRYWRPGCHLLAVSPEDCGCLAETIVHLAESSESSDLPRRLGMTHIERRNDIRICYHVVLITSRARLLLPEKFRNLLAEIVGDVAVALGADVVACSAMRNHLHLLCYLPPDEAFSGFLHKLKAGLLAAMRSNLHFRKAEEWSDDSIAFTVTPGKISQEEHDVLEQQTVHGSWIFGNEMARLSPRLRIPFFTALN